MAEQLRKVSVVFQADQKQFINGAEKVITTTKRVATQTTKSNEEIEEAYRESGLAVRVFDDAAGQAAATLRENAKAEARAARAVNYLKNEYSAMSGKIGLTNDELEVYNAKMRLGTGATKEQEKQVEQLVRDYQRLRDAQGGATAATKKHAGGLRNIRGIAQSAGYQLQDVAVQLQQGTDGIRVFTQQGSQFAAAFGPTGAVVGAILAVGGALAGSLIPGLLDSGDAAEELAEKLRSIKDVNDLTAAQANLLAQEQAKLARESKDLAIELELANEELELENKILHHNMTAFANSSEALREYREEMTENNEEINKNAAEIDYLNAVVDAAKEKQEALESVVSRGTDTIYLASGGYAEMTAQFKAWSDQLSETIHIAEQAARATVAPRATTPGEDVPEAAARAEHLLQIERNRLDKTQELYDNYHEIRRTQAVETELMEIAIAERLSEEEEARWENLYTTGREALTSLSALQESENEKMKKVGQTAAIIQATIDTYRAANAAYAAMAGIPGVGPGLGIAAAAAAVTAGLANVDKISGAFDKGGYIPSGSLGIVSEYGDELVNGQLVKGPARVTSREETADIMNRGGDTIIIQAMDAQSFERYSRQNSGAITKAVRRERRRRAR